jgi:hypothetical protein
MHAFLDRSTAAALAAITLELTIPVAAANAHDRARQSADAPDQVAQSQSVRPASPDTKTEDATQSSTTGPDGRAQTQRMKHPPTAQMDSATPTEKTTNGKPASEKHPPTSTMDNATPDEKSPGSRQ